MKKRKSNKKFNNFKKTIKGFIQDEEGYINKEKILKIGLGTISAIGIVGALSSLGADHASHSNHGNGVTLQNEQHPTERHCWRFKATHASHAAHASHNSY
ncbi:MAG: hypothetical protein ISS47_05870 [Candidatus Omnitrophica bacterium]|nr:hypothetical protein [Candidatus Omnitrophota bacterium]